MIVDIYDWMESGDWDDEYRNYTIKINGSDVLSMSDCIEPEDATLSRDLSDVLNIPDMIKKAYEAGVAGQKFEMVLHSEPPKES